jgi:hypothetical protein
MMEIGI